MTCCVCTSDSDGPVHHQHPTHKLAHQREPNWWTQLAHRFRAIFRQQKEKGDATIIHHQAPERDPTNHRAVLLATPNHIDVTEMEQIGAEEGAIANEKCKWQRSILSALRLEKDMRRDWHGGEISMKEIRPKGSDPPKTANPRPPTALPASKPADLWRSDQSMMLNGRYALDAAFLAKYRLKQLLGEGSFGFVWIAGRIRDQKEVAVKFILREKVPASSWIFDGELGLVPLEVHLLRRLIHRNIIQYLDSFSDSRFVYLVTELHGTSWTWPNPRIDPKRNPGLRPPGQLLQLVQNSSREGVGVAGVTRRPPCDLFECIEAHGRLPESTIHKILSQLVDAVLYLRAMGIVHRDLKDENIAVDEHYNIKILDFGSASLIPRLKPERSLTCSSPSSFETWPHQQQIDTIADQDGSSSSSPISNDEEGYFEKFNGTVAFASPEIIKGQRYRATEAEVWALGVLLYTMVFKKSPFSSPEAILTSPLDLPLEETPGVYDLIRRMLQKNPLNRIRLEEIKNHSFLLRYSQNQ